MTPEPLSKSMSKRELGHIHVQRDDEKKKKKKKKPLLCDVVRITKKPCANKHRR
jgi:hypothetical protein